MTPIHLFFKFEWHLKSPIMIQGGVSPVQYHASESLLNGLGHVSPGFSSGTLAKGGLEIDSHHRMALSTTLDAVKSESIMRSAEHGSGIMVSRF